MRLPVVAFLLAAGLVARPVSAAFLGQESAFASVKVPVPQLGAEDVGVRKQLVALRLQLDGLLAVDGVGAQQVRVARLALFERQSAVRDPWEP